VAPYENELETDINDEFVQFHKLLKTDFGKPVVKQHQSAESVEHRVFLRTSKSDYESICA